MVISNEMNNGGGGRMLLMHPETIKKNAAELFNRNLLRTGKEKEGGGLHLHLHS